MGKVGAYYIWLGGNGEFRSKLRTVNSLLFGIEHYPEWNYDGSSTDQASGEDSEVIIKPRAQFRSTVNNCVYILCDTYKPNGEPLPNNTRTNAAAIFDQAPEHEPWFGIEQEYFIMNRATGKPIGFPEDVDAKQGQYYCSVGSKNTFGRELAETHYKMCLEYGIKLSGLNAEVAPGQWEWQCGPCLGIEAGDHVLMARYFLELLTEGQQYYIDWSPKPVAGDWNGSGCHTNYSTKFMREGSGVTKDQAAVAARKGQFLPSKSGLDYINEAVEKLSRKHKEHMDVYGSGNELRMTGAHETAKYDEFSSGVANRGASVRIGNQTVRDGKGYFEDRRPSSNMDPYLVTSKLFETTVLGD